LKDPQLRSAVVRFVTRLLFRGGMLRFEVPSQPSDPGLLKGVILILVAGLAGDCQR
jgi:hypothetical protein